MYIVKGMAIDLLPAEHEAPPCAPFTRNLGASPAGSGLGLDRIVLVSVPGPWPKPALSHSTLKPLVAPLTASPVITRLFAAEPVVGCATIEVFDRSALGATRQQFEADSSSTIDEQHAWLQQTVSQIAQSPQASAGHELEDPVMLVCTQGSHDMCCGVQGQAFAELLEARSAGIHVRRVSHTGGHRFAPTAVSLPDGRMWAWLDEELVDRIVGNRLTDEDLRMRCRGWWGAPKGTAQVAELAARIDNGGPFVHEPSIEAADDTMVVTSGNDRWTVRVEQAREIPTIACESPGGLPVKQGIEYGWTITGRTERTQG